MMTDPIDPAIRTEIDARLAAIEQQEDVRILFAVESGSRAWGFPSPDSDYDVRFVYVRRRDAYLSLTPPRDVIEQPIVDEIDLNGWDLRKALLLLLKSNATLGEWIVSPIRYRPDDMIVVALASLADTILNPRALAHHYANLGRGAAERWLDGDGPVPVKKYFYALRPALVLRCLRGAPDTRPPMNLQELVARCDLPSPLADDIAGLVEAKRRTNERGNAVRLPALDALIRAELAGAAILPERLADADARARAAALFLQRVNAQ